MRIVQLIDSLQTGGAERVAVNYANELASKIEFSGLVVSRVEGDLKQFIEPSVDYCFLNKSKTFDFKALLKLKAYLLKNNIDFLHAHNTSFFFAFLLKIIYPKINVIWHDHYGNRTKELYFKNIFVLFCCLFFSKIITVNDKMKIWFTDKGFKKVIFLNNFPVLNEENIVNETLIKGLDGKRIVSLANLRPEKNHFLLLDVAKKMKDSHPDWSFHLVGVNFNDEYSESILDMIKKNDLEKHVFYYGKCLDVSNILKQVDIGILTSNFEGLPMAFLEYGINSLPVLCTNVGELPKIVKNFENGLIVEKGDVNLFYSNLVYMIENDKERITMGRKLKENIEDYFSAKIVMEKYLEFLYL